MLSDHKGPNVGQRSATAIVTLCSVDIPSEFRYTKAELQEEFCCGFLIRAKWIPGDMFTDESKVVCGVGVAVFRI